MSRPARPSPLSPATARRGAALATALVALGLAVIAWLGDRDAPAADAPTGGASIAARRIQVPPGSELVYRLHYAARKRLQSDALEGQVLDGRAALDAILVVRDRGRDGARQRVGLSFEAIERAELVVRARDLLAGRDVDAELGASHELVLELEPSGRIARTLVAPEATELHSNLMAGIAAELQLELGAGQTWSVVEQTQNGQVLSDYAVTAEFADGLALERTRDRYRMLDGIDDAATSSARVVAHHTAKLAAAGYLDRLTGSESIAAPGIDAYTEVELALVRTRATKALPLALATWSPRGLRAGGGTDEELLRARADGMTWEELEAVLARHADTGQVPDHNRFLWRATGYLMLHPEACAKLQAVFVAEGASSSRRALILDLLASAGHEPAQDALRGLLATPAALDDAAYPLLFQRLGLVPHASPATLDFLEQRYLAATGDDHMVAAYTLAAAAGTVRDTDPTRNQRTRDWLGQALREAEDPDDRANYLRALANTNDPAAATLALEHAGDDDSGVRLAAVEVLALADSDDSERVLVELAHDESPSVQRASLRALAGYGLDDDTRGSLAASVRDGRLIESSYEELLRVVEEQRAAGHDDWAASVLETMAAHDAREPALRARIDLQRALADKANSTTAPGP